MRWAGFHDEFVAFMKFLLIVFCNHRSFLVSIAQNLILASNLTGVFTELCIYEFHLVFSSWLDKN